MKNKPIRILLVEDNPGDVALFEEILNGTNTVQFEMTHCNTLSSALTFLCKRSFDIILLDLSLPDGEGLDTVVRTHAAMPNVPIVVMSGLGDEELAVRALRKGAQDYLVKGQVDCNLLIRSMRYAIERKQAEDALRKAHDKLELRVHERTAELEQANKILQTEIVERKNAEEMMRRQLENMTTLREIGVAIASSLDLNVTLNILLEKLIGQLGVDAANVLLLDPNTLYLNFSTGLGFWTSGIQSTHVRVGKGHAGQVAFERRPLIIPDLSETLTYALTEEKFKSYIAMPLIAHGKIEGVLEIFHRRLFKPTPDWMNFLELMSGQAALAIDNAALFNNLQRANIELTLSYDTTLEGWGRALEFRDADTKGHTERVTEMTMRLAQLLGVDEHDLVHVRRGSLLHDIGKIHIPDSILLKPGPLTREEKAIMQRHPVYAHELLSPIPFLRPALEIPYCHHEKWDGSGYPRGLKGELIPFHARIFSVIDVADALISDRPYRKALSVEKTYGYIESQKGIYFAPEVVDAFLGMKW
jgi:response regulator RpfG family c-di-GMP phosphodiesterase